MNNIDGKLMILNAIRNQSSYYRVVNDSEYLARCPFCGDSDNPNKGHFYLNVLLDENSPIKYHCAKCGQGGTLSPFVLRKMGIDSMPLKQVLDVINRYSGKNDRRMISMDAYRIFDYQLPDRIKYPEKLRYIEKRLGFRVTDDIIEDCRIVTSLHDLLIHNNINRITCQPWLANTFEKDYIGFMSYGNSYLLLRDVTNSHGDAYKWIKYPLTEASRGSKVFYSIRSEINPFTRDDITINCAEGVFDILSVAYNLGQKRENILNAAVTGKEYAGLITYLISIGLFGENVSLNIYSDNDKDYNKKKSKKKRVKTELGDYINDLYPFKFLMKEVLVRYNLLSKDCGVPVTQIALESHRL